MIYTTTDSNYMRFMKAAKIEITHAQGVNVLQLVLHVDNFVIDVYRGITSPVKIKDGVKWESGEVEGLSVNYCLVEEHFEILPGDFITDEFITANGIPIQPSEMELLKKQQTALLFELMIKGLL